MKQSDIIDLMDGIAPILARSLQKAIAPLVVRLEAAESELAALKAIGVPKDGRDGVDGKDGEPGRDGVDGKDGEPGVDGKDGTGLADALKDHEGVLVLTMTDGRIVKIGRVDGDPGKDGTDGLGFDDLEVVDEGATYVLRWSRGEKVRECRLAKPTLADMHKGIWQPGAYQRGAVVTWGGSTWLAKADTEKKPEATDDWVLITKRGRDGKDAAPDRPPSKVRL